MQHMELYMILMGLAIGFVFGRLFSYLQGSLAFNLFIHIRGVVLLATASWFCVVMMSEDHHLRIYLCLIFAFVTSFFVAVRR